MNEQDTIDLGVIRQIISRYKWQLLAIVVCTTVLAALITLVLPKQYESTVLLKAKGQKQGGLSLQSASAALAILGGNAISPTQAYIEMLKSRSVLEPVISALDLPGKEKIDNEGFAGKYLKIQNTKGTDLIEITATGRSPEEAQKIAANVVSSFQQELTTLNQTEQSLMTKFLKERITIAKQEMEQAERNLEDFRQKEKIYVPDEQTKAAIMKLAEYDQKIAQIKVQNETNQTKLWSISQQLEKQNIALTTYNMADNPTIQQIRSSIITKEMSLVEMNERYTDKHPNVVLVKKELNELKTKLKDEVSKSVEAGTNTLNPVHASLIMEKTLTETEILVGQTSLDTLRGLQSQGEREISILSANSMSYIGLERQVRITQEVYGVIVKNYEQTRIQEAMESMDIQIVDPANLPNKSSAPRKVLITAIGGVVGVMLGFMFVIIAYSRENRRQNQTPI